MKTLPVPPLAQTLDRYLEAVTPLLDEDALARTRAAVRAFADGDGPRCQADLEEFAAHEAQGGRSWLWDAWLEAYNVSRTPLPLVSNVAFDVVVPSVGSGLDRAAEVLHRVVAAHLAHLRGEGGQDLSARGEVLDLAQWDSIAGGVREPRRGLDVFAPGSADPADREVVVLWRGRAVAVRVSDETGHPLSVAALRAALGRVVALPPADGPDVTSPAYLGGDEAAALLDDLRTEPANQRLYDRLREALVVLHLDDRGGTDEEHLARSVWGPGHAWPFKPASYQVDLADDALTLQLEHSTLDASTLVAILGRAQAVEPVPGEPGDDAATEELAWVLTGDQVGRLEEAMDAFARVAGRQRLRIVEVPAPALPPVDFKVSLDALMQTVMLYAQLRTYGRVRSTYESVDMREYQGGRTECLRPNTAANVALARGLVDGTATVDDLRAHLASHREQVKRCKAGQAIDRHLFGLRLMAQRGGYDAPLFDDPGYTALTTDFLSTTSLGEPSRIVRVGFCPTSRGGIGIYYVPLAGSVELTVCWEEGTAERVPEFVEALRDGVDAVWLLVSSAAA